MSGNMLSFASQQDDRDGCGSVSEAEDLDLVGRSPSPMPLTSAMPSSGDGPSLDGTATKEASALLISASDKAGMTGIDRARINEIMLRESGNSTFMQRQRKLDENTNVKIEEMKKRLQEKDSSATNDWRKEMRRSDIEPLLQRFRSERRPISTCVVFDMDSFFISCHILDHPHLAGIPACVGGMSMISTSNYVARRYGVRAAMPGYLGQTLVKELSGGKESLTFVRSDFDLYKRKSSEVRAVLEEYDPNLNMYSLDEAYMDIGPYLEIQLLQGELSQEEIKKKLLDKSNPSTTSRSPLRSKDVQDADNTSGKELLSVSTIHSAAQSLLHTIREKVKTTTGLTCSAGLCSNFLLAKIASDINKPNGQHFVGPSEEEILAFVNPLPIRKVSGIGRVMEKTLRGVCGVETVKDLYDKRAEAFFLFKPATAQFLMRASIGYAEGKRHESTEDDGGDTEEALNRKGISHERTFSPTSDWSAMCTKLEGITLSLVQDLRERKLRPKTITLKVKLANFDILTRATTTFALFQNCNNRSSAQDLVDIVINLLKEAKREHANGGGATKKSGKVTIPKAGPCPFSVRLLGVRCSNFQLEKDNQSSLDRFRTVGRQEDVSKPVSLPQSTDSTNTAEAPTTSPMVKNPYLSPKTTSSASPIGIDEKDGSSRSKCSLYKSPPPDPKPKRADTQSERPANDNEMPGLQIQCPLCHKCFQTDKHNNVEINANIDACLNASTVKQLAKEETKCADERSKKKRRRLSDFFNS